MEVSYLYDLQIQRQRQAKKKGSKKMVRSMVAAVAGLKSHQSKMDVIGNNIANVNSWGYKGYSYHFADSMYANSTNSSAGSTLAGGAGGRNASQVGYGSVMSSITNEFGTGAPSPSSNPLDCMIDGTGFFLVGNMVNGTFTNVESSGLFLSRVGIFRVDSNGYLVDDQRSYVYGYAVQAGTGIPEVPATAASYKVTGADVEVVKNGAAYTVTIAGIPVESAHDDLKDQINDWIKAVAGKEVQIPGGTGTTADATFLNYNISLTNYQESTDPAVLGGTVNLTITKKTTGDDSGPAGADLLATKFGNDKIETTNKGNTRVASVDPVYADELSAIQIPIDTETGKQYEIQSYKINEDGTIIGVDKQNRTIPIGQLALVTVENPNGLEKTTGYYYTPGANAGDIGAMKPNGGPSGKIKGGYLEMANVDLANEFSNMITCQRGFQANSKIITVTDEMLQELVNMKR